MCVLNGFLRAPVLCVCETESLILVQTTFGLFNTAPGILDFYGLQYTHIILVSHFFAVTLACLLQFAMHLFLKNTCVLFKLSIAS